MSNQELVPPEPKEVYEIVAPPTPEKQIQGPESITKKIIESGQEAKESDEGKERIRKEQLEHWEKIEYEILDDMGKCQTRIKESTAKLNYDEFQLKTVREEMKKLGGMNDAERLKKLEEGLHPEMKKFKLQG